MKKQNPAKDQEAGAPDTFSDLIAATNAPETAVDFAGGTLERSSIAERVTNRILEMIKSGNLKSGDRLPTEQQMTIAFGISRPPLREALKALTIMGVLESRQGGRYTVSDLSPSRLVAPFNAILSLGRYDVHEHFQARAAVELELVRLSALNASKAERERIVKLARDGHTFYSDPVAFRLMDLELHQAIYNASGNAMLSAIALGLYDLALDIRRVASNNPAVIEKSVSQHCEIADAIMAGDADNAVAAYRRHIEHVRDTTIQSMAERT